MVRSPLLRRLRNGLARAGQVLVGVLLPVILLTLVAAPAAEAITAPELRAQRSLQIGRAHV